MKDYNILSLCDGMSCGQIALNKIGIKPNFYFASEIDKSAIYTTQHNFPDTIQIGDVTLLDTSKLPKIDILMAGTPCQNFSIAGKKRGMVTTDNIDILSLDQYLNLKEEGMVFEGQSYLFWEYVRILKETQPKYFLLENVKMKQYWQDVISKQLGVEPIRINSSLVSAAKRDRLYWTNIPDVTIPEDKNITFDDINSDSQDWIPEERIEKIRAWKAQQKPIDVATRIGLGKKLPCLTARGYNQYHSGMVLITDGTRYRYLTNEEAEKAHNIPVGYTQGNDRERSHMIGNGWTIDVISNIFSFIKNEIKKN